ncbi:MAG: BamA/TamA family outer membrane protein [Timaviella obliquedivisa GSE-PSE-MK23-08B]|nr:BamA/TamA family outer membrane protein [Timaviella obliquedivisa GSE-PSE-MK23-08B]
MRCSPVLLAVLTASAAFSFTRPAQAQAPALDQQATHNWVAASFNPTALELDEDLEGLVLPLANKGAVTPEQVQPEFSRSTANAWLEVAPTSDRQEIAQATPVQQTQLNPPTAGDQAPIPEPPVSPTDLPTQPTDPVVPVPNPVPSPVIPDPVVPPTPVDPGTLDPTVPIPTDPGTPEAPQVPPAPLPPGTLPTPSTAEPTAPEPRVLVAEVTVEGVEGDLQNTVYQAIRTVAGRTTTRSQLQEDINAIFATGFFSNVRVAPEDTPLGVRVAFTVEPNPSLRSVRLEGSSVETITYQGEEVPTQAAIDGIFGSQYGRIINLNEFQAGVAELNKLYQDNGYVLAQVIDAPQVAPDGQVTLAVAEGEIENIQLRFLNRDGDATDDQGEPIRGRTRDFIITREFESQPGDVFNRDLIQADLQRAFALGIFEDLSLSLNPSQTDPRKVEVVVNVTERRTGSIGASAGLSSSSGLFGAINLTESNLGGNNQSVGAQVQVGERALLFDLSFTDPWIGGDPYRTSYTVNAFGRQSVSQIFDGGSDEIQLQSTDLDELNSFDDATRPRIFRLGTGVTFARPLDNGWRASLGAQVQRVTIQDGDGDRVDSDRRFINEDGEVVNRATGRDLTFTSDGVDYLATLQFSASQDRRNNPTATTSGSLLRFSTEQSLPLDGILFNRLRASYSYFIPTSLTRFTTGCRQEDRTPTDCPETIALSAQVGTVLGDLPPYEAFALGGDGSVRAYDGGEIGSGRSFAQITAEYRFPIVSIVSGILFVDAASDLGSGDSVPGNPAGDRGKPGSGFGYGAGLQVNSPLGQIRVFYGIADDGSNRFSFGLGERF